MNIAALKNLRVVRLLAIMFLVAVFVVSSSVIAVYFLATPDKIRAAIIPVIEDKLKCDIEFAQIDVSLFSGVRFTSLSLADPDGGEPWLQVNEAVLRYRFLPLLKRRLVIDELRLDAPLVLARRNANGAIAVGNILHKPQNTSGTQITAESDREHKNVDFHISTIVVANAEVLVRDFVFGPIPRLTRLQDVGLQLDNFSAESEWKFTLWGKLNGAPVDAQGDFDPLTDKGSLKLVMEGLDLVAFQPYYRGHLPFKINRLKVSTQCRVLFGPDEIDLQGDINLEDADITDIAPFASADKTFNAQQVDANLHLVWEHRLQQARLLQADVRMDGLDIGAHGTASFDTEQHEYAVDVELIEWPVRALASHAALPWLDRFGAYAPAGTCSAELAWRKDAKDLYGTVRSGSVILEDAGLSVGGLRFGISGEIGLEGNKLNASSLSAKIGGESIQTSMFSKNWRAGHPRFKLNLKADKIDVWNILQQTGGRGATDSSVKASRIASEPGPYAIPFDIDAAFEFKNVLWRNVILQQARGVFSIVNNELVLHNLAAGFASGKLSSEARIDLGQQGFSYNINLSGEYLDIEQTVATLWPGFSGTVSGRGELKAQITGAGTQRLRVRQNLSGNVHLAVENGNIRGVNTLHALAHQFNIPSATRLDFIAASADLQFMTGSPPRLTLLGRNEEMRLSFQGRIEWQGAAEGTLSLYLLPSLAAEVSPKFLSSAEIDQNGWNVFESNVAGSVAKPEFIPASSQR